LSPPVIAPAKGSGAIRGLGEKFTTNAVNGTSAFSIPIGVTPARSGFAPQLAVSYNSGNGNGVFGIGWSLNLPQIARKTDRGLPRYDDGDVFVLSSADDLVPIPASETAPPAAPVNMRVVLYRPRLEGTFARIEHWLDLAAGTSHWRTISRDNVTTIFGADATSRIAGAAIYAGQGASPREFAWLITRSFDDRGNAVRYDWVGEDGAGVDRTATNEGSRERSANRYLKRIRYGNRVPYDPNTVGADLGFSFEVVLDYDESHIEDVPANPQIAADEQHRFVRASREAVRPWRNRPDPFSTYRAGFEVRTHRRCRRILTFHDIASSDTGAGYTGLVRSTEFIYDDFPAAPTTAVAVEMAHAGSTRFNSRLCAVVQHGHTPASTPPAADARRLYLTRSLPAIRFAYTRANFNDAIEEPASGALDNVPSGLADHAMLLVDLDGEGLPGILHKSAGSWCYKRNEGEVPGDGVSFASSHDLALLPSLAHGGDLQLVDLDGDGRLEAAETAPPLAGFYRRCDDGWSDFKPFARQVVPTGEAGDRRGVDLTGDGLPDILVAEGDSLFWHASLGAEGYDTGRRIYLPHDENAAPRVVFNAPRQSIFIADMSGDGLPDLVRIRNDEVCYWPNLGYGRFGARIVMDDCPVFDAPDGFDPARLRLADVAGSGVTDIVYLGRDSARVYFNCAGNAWSGARRIASMPTVDRLADVTLADIKGQGTGCLVWSSPLPSNSRRALRIIDILGGTKPNLLARVTNGLGAETEITYTASTRFYLADKRAGRPWLTRLPFPVHVVETVTTRDLVGGSESVSRYAYHHGYFDGIEREFRGFALVEQWDSESVAVASSDSIAPASVPMPPVRTRTWFHLGNPVSGAEARRQFAHEFYADGSMPAPLLDEPELPASLDAHEEREAFRALKGTMLRREVYADDDTALAPIPYEVAEQSHVVRCLHPRRAGHHAVFQVLPFEMLTLATERRRGAPRMAHSITLAADPFGTPLLQVVIAYGSPQPHFPEQATTHVVATRASVTNSCDATDAWRAPVVWQTETLEVGGYRPASGLRFTPADFESLLDEVSAPAALVPLPRTETRGALPVCIEHDAAAPGTGRWLRTMEHVRTLFRRESFDLPGSSESAALPAGKVESRALVHETYKLALSEAHLARIFTRREAGGASTALLPGGDDLRHLLREDGGYVSGDTLAGSLFPTSDAAGQWWIPSGRAYFSETAATPQDDLAAGAAQFFQPRRIEDAFGGAVRIRYDSTGLVPVETRDALGNTVQASAIDYRVVQPSLITDANGNRTAVAFDAFGAAAGVAVMGKAGETLDDLDGFEADLTAAEARGYLALGPDGTIVGLARRHLARATSRFVADPQAWAGGAGPAFAVALARDVHAGTGQQPAPLVTITYSDGFGRAIQNRAMVAPGIVDDIGLCAPRWVVSGWTRFNNKGLPVQQLESLFSPFARFERVERGVGPIMFYDPLGRAVAILAPDHTFSTVTFDGWREDAADANDTAATRPEDDPVLGPFLVANRSDRIPGAHFRPSWLEHRRAFGGRAAAAAEQTLLHDGTATTKHLDSLGRAFSVVARNRRSPGQPMVEITSRTRLDAAGRPLEIIDPRGNAVMRFEAIETDTSGAVRGRRTGYSIAGVPLYQTSMDGGERWILHDVAGNPLRAFDARGHAFRYTYDVLRRPLARLVAGPGAGVAAREITYERIVYGEAHPMAGVLNLRGRVFATLDGAGLLLNCGRAPDGRQQAFDGQGNLLRSTRLLAADPTTPPDWSRDGVLLPADVESAFRHLLAAERFEGATWYDALGRLIQSQAVRSDRTTDGYHILRPHYDTGGQLDRIDGWIGLLSPVGPHEAPVSLPTVFVSSIEYDAKGRRKRIAYGNGVVTTLAYDVQTFRLAGMRSERKSAAGAEAIQDLTYVYDAGGNIISIDDAARPRAIFDGIPVDAERTFTYDALNRLIAASGREHGSVLGSAPGADDWRERMRTHPADARRMYRYVETYDYDEAGNILAVRHRTQGAPSGQEGWRRCYHYATDSNRLLHTADANADPDAGCGSPYRPAGPLDAFGHDAHGSMTRMPHLSEIRWDAHDRLIASARSVDPNGRRTVYTYGASGQRVRKATLDAAGAIVEERIYFGSVELLRKRARAGAAAVERQTLHVMDGEKRIAMIERRTMGTDAGPALLVRYQLPDHLGSATMELTADARVVSVSEYHPYGTLALHLGDGGLEAPKRYCFTGMERDEETGLQYHTARYYAPWLGRWTSADPIQSNHRYAYCNCCPTLLVDRTGNAPSCEGREHCTFDPENEEDAAKLSEMSGGHPEWSSEEVRQINEDNIALQKYQANTNWIKREVHRAADSAASVGAWLSQTRPIQALGRFLNSASEALDDLAAAFDRSAGDTFGNALPIAALDKKYHIGSGLQQNAHEIAGPSLRAGAGAVANTVGMVGDAKLLNDVATKVLEKTATKFTNRLIGRQWNKLGHEFEDIAMKEVRSRLGAKAAARYDDKKRVLAGLQEATKKQVAWPEAVIYGENGDITVIFDAKIGAISPDQGMVYIDNLAAIPNKKPGGALIYVSPDANRPIPTALVEYAEKKGVKIRQMMVPWSADIPPKFTPTK
jgi:RHS repeat-associated protein